MGKCHSIPREDEIAIKIKQYVDAQVRPDLTDYLADAQRQFQKKVEDEYFASVVRFKENHLSIKLHRAVDFEQIQVIKIENDEYEFVLTVRDFQITRLAKPGGVVGPVHVDPDDYDADGDFGGGHAPGGAMLPYV